MSYWSMHWEDVKCDFPDCSKEFDKRPGRKVAIVKGDILAFCAEHCVCLTREGVNLRVLADIHREQDEAREAPIRNQMERERIARENAFIRRLK